MAEEIKIIDVTQKNLQELPCCIIKNINHEGHQRKTNWLKKHLEKGLQAKVLLSDKNSQFGYIEYLPGEYAWRGVNANGYMFIHCLCNFSKKHKRKGYGRFLIQSCIDDAKKSKMKGVAVVARKSPWLANSDIFLKNGFEIVNAVPPDYELLAFKLKKSASNPAFKDNWDKKLEKYGKGLTFIHSNQCPHTVKFSNEIIEMTGNFYKLEPKVIELKTYKDAQNAPTPYAVFAVIYNGKLLADYPISRARFRNIMNKVLH